jgi:hypothetical protein
MITKCEVTDLVWFGGIRFARDAEVVLGYRRWEQGETKEKYGELLLTEQIARSLVEEIDETNRTNNLLVNCFVLLQM